MKLEYPPGATPLDRDSIATMIPNLTTQSELNEFEAQNIIDAERWAQTNPALARELCTVGALQRLHERMFNQTWKWAGKFRTVQTNIGVDSYQIPAELANLCGDIAYWVENGIHDWIERAVRFHHRLAVIHPFPNGNGRHARLAADLLLEFNGQHRLPWGGRSLTPAGPLRDQYIEALRAADKHDIAPLIDFAKS